MANKISVIIDVAVDKGVTSLKKFRTAIGEVDTASGKMRAGFGVAKELITANAAEIAMAAGSALVAFGVKSVQAFQDTALAAGKFSDATGLAVDDASRFIEVAGDIGIEAGTVETALGKMNKTLGGSPELFAELGVEIAKTSTGATDVNGTFLNVVDRLNAIADPAERARVASQLLGKGWQGMAELIGQGSTALKASLAGVADAQVIDEEEQKKAEKLRDSMDELKDRVERFSLTLGESLVPALVEAADDVIWLTDKVGDFNSAVEDATGNDLGGWADKLTSPVNVATSAMDWFTDAIGSNVSATDGISYAWDYFTGNLEDGTTAIEYGTKAADEMARIYGERLTPRTNDVADATANATQKFQDAKTGFEAYYDALANEQAFSDLASSLGEMQARLEDSSVSAAEQAADLNAAKRAVIDYADEVGGIPTSTITKILTILDQGDYRQAAEALARLAAPRTAQLNIQAALSIGGQRTGADLRNAMEGRTAGEAAGKAAADAFTTGFNKGSKSSSTGGNTPRTPQEIMADWDRVFASLYKMGEWDLARYRATLQQRLGAYAKYSDDYMRVWSELRSLDEQEQARKDAAAQAEQDRIDNAHTLGELSDAEYIASLQNRMAAYDRYSNEYVAIWKTIQGLRQKEFDQQEAAAKAEQARLDEAERAQQRLLDAEQNRMSASRGNALGILTINVTNTAADPQSVVRAIEQARRLYGSRWLAG